MVERGSNVRWNDDGSLTIWTVLPATGTHGIEPVIDRVYPFGGAIDAFRAMKAGDLFGRIMLDMAA